VKVLELELELALVRRRRRVLAVLTPKP